MTPIIDDVTIYSNNTIYINSIVILGLESGFMKQVTLKVTEETHAFILENAEAKNLTITDFLLSHVVPNYLQNLLTVDEVTARLSSLNSGEVFTIPSLFSDEEWNNFTSGSRVSTGRLFRQAIDKLPLKNEVEYMKKNSANLAIYRKI